MNQDDRDNLFSLMVFYTRLMDWKNEKNTNLNEKDKKKIIAITNIMMDLILQYGRRDSELVLNSIIEESKKYKFAIIPIEEDIDVIGTFEPTIIKTSLKNIMKQCCQCSLCDREDYAKCDWYAIHKFVESKEKENGKKACPFKENINDLFDTEI